MNDPSFSSASGSEDIEMDWTGRRLHQYDMVLHMTRLENDNLRKKLAAKESELSNTRYDP